MLNPSLTLTRSTPPFSPLFELQRRRRRRRRPPLTVVFLLGGVLGYALARKRPQTESGAKSSEELTETSPNQE